MEKNVLELFKVMVRPKTTHVNDFSLELAKNGVVTNFVANENERRLLLEVFKPLNVRTLFSRQERENASFEDLIFKQLMHYVEVYSLNTPGLFDLEFDDGQMINFTFIKGVSVSVLKKMIKDIIYTNAPIKNVQEMYEIIKYYDIRLDINKIENNELKIMVFNPVVDIFDNGDDAVRWMCYIATNNTLLIKSDEVIAAVKENYNKFSANFFNNHAYVLSQVFNRHKRIILAAKKGNTRSYINNISRMSKSTHVPIREAINKTFLAKALDDTKFDMSVLNKDNISVRDKFKYLSLIQYKKLRLTTDMFIIRNGKIHIEEGRKTYSMSNLIRVEDAIINSLRKDLAHLQNENILLDPYVDYGLPVSRKQTMGNLPFGTTINLESETISSGIYWKNEWGATDLDLSTIDIDGSRVGWGQGSGYNRRDIIYSGDVTSAQNGAMEFMTSSERDYSLEVNIYSGRVGCSAEIVIGTTENIAGDSSKWMKDVVIREKVTLDSNSNIIGFVKGNQFIVYNGRLGNSSISTASTAILNKKALMNHWTLKMLFTVLNINFDVYKVEDKVYKYNMNYESFSYDKLEDLLLK